MSGPGPVHAGVLVPWANIVVEAELHRVTGTSVAWHYARLVPASRSTEMDERFLTGLLDAVPTALGQLAALPLRRTYLACTSAAFMYPDLAMAARQNAPVALVSAFDAITAALTGLGARRIVLLTPYPNEVTKAEVRLFAQCGFTVTESASLDLYGSYDAVNSGQVKELIRRISRAAIDAADAVVLSCTGWPTFDLIPDIERDLGRPVISSNLAIGRHALEAKEI